MRQGIAFFVVLAFVCLGSVVCADQRDDLLFEDFETNDGGFLGSLDWEWGTMTWSGAGCESDNFPPAGAFSGTGMWATVLNDCYSNYSNNSGYDTCINGDPTDDSILSFEIDLTGQTDATLSFYEWFDAFLQWDWAEVRVNDTSVFQHCGGSFVEPTAWEEQVIDLTPFVGAVATIEFHFLSSGVINHAGWYIDDVRVYTGSPGPTPTPGPTMTPDPTVTPYPTITPTPDNCVNHGDANLDGSVTAGDAQLAFQIALGSVTPPYEQFCAADCNCDEFVTAGDAQAIFMVALGSGACFDPVF